MATLTMCAICTDSFPPSEDSPEPQLSDNVNLFIQQLGINSGLSSRDLLGLSACGGDGGGGVSLCEECLLLILSATEWREQVDDLEEGVRKLQHVIVKMMRQISKLVDNYGKDMGKLQQKIKVSDEPTLRSKVSRGDGVFRLRDGVVNVVQDLSSCRDDLATKLVRKPRDRGQVILTVINKPVACELETSPVVSPVGESDVKLEPQSDEEIDDVADEGPSTAPGLGSPFLQEDEAETNHKIPRVDDKDETLIAPVPHSSVQNSNMDSSLASPCPNCLRWNARQEAFEVKLSGILIGINKKIEEMRANVQPGILTLTTPASPTIPCELPISSLENLELLEKWLATPQHRNYFVSKLRQLGRRGKYSKTIYYLLGYIFQHQFSLGVRYTSITGKIPVKDTRIVGAICDAVPQLHPGILDKPIRDSIATWFRSSCDRGGGRKSRGDGNVSKNQDNMGCESDSDCSTE